MMINYKQVNIKSLKTNSKKCLVSCLLKKSITFDLIDNIPWVWLIPSEAYIYLLNEPFPL